MYILLLPSSFFYRLDIGVGRAGVISNQSSQGQRDETVAVWLKAQDRSRVLASGARHSEERDEDRAKECSRKDDLPKCLIQCR